MSRLVITRKPQESFQIADGLITITVTEVVRNQVKLAISAPREIKVLRSELVGEKRNGR